MCWPHGRLACTHGSRNAAPLCSGVRWDVLRLLPSLDGYGLLTNQRKARPALSDCGYQIMVNSGDREYLTVCSPLTIFTQVSQAPLKLKLFLSYSVQDVGVNHHDSHWDWTEMGWICLCSWAGQASSLGENFLVHALSFEKLNSIAALSLLILPSHKHSH